MQYSPTAATHRKLVQALGWLGLLPFAGLAGSLVFYGHNALVEKALVAYSFGILAFLLGSWWGIALIRPDKLALIASNLLFLVILAGLLLLEPVWFMRLCALSFLLLPMLERALASTARAPGYYRRLRWGLALSASSALLAASAAR